MSVVGKTVACFGSGSGQEGESAYDAMRLVGELLTRQGVTVITGGYGGSGMEAPLRGVVEAGSTTACGYTLAYRDRPNDYCPRRVVCGVDVHAEPNDELKQYTIRLDLLLRVAHGFIVEPTDTTPGTMIEFLSVINANIKFWQKHPKPIALLDTGKEAYWYKECSVRLDSRPLSRPWERNWIKTHNTPADAVVWLLEQLRS